ncbi:DUF1194 domain-containing protein [Marimonas sp. MJW-29]|uniref:DUF1194 domain-containing protein n=1 Tax=Sulfitobacter sediminis TaxID=3234186 RepID=A0ABV3RLW8_9RHOB
MFTTWATTASAQTQVTEVDLELVLLVDVSRSMTENELEIQRRGYAEALMSEEVFQAVQSGLLQTLALTYVEWAGTQQIIVDWSLIQTREDLDAFAEQLTTRFDPALRRTSISGALDYAATLIKNNSYAGLRRVIDISGDGPNNLGPLVTRARDRTLAKGITINGLPLMTDEGSSTFFHLDRLDLYYTSCVIGGPGAFVIPVYDWPDFATAVKRKLVLEIAGLPAQPQLIRAQSSRRDPTDCMVGEKIWRDFRENSFWDP